MRDPQTIDIDNYLDILDITEAEAADAQTLEEKYNEAKSYWSSLANQGLPSVAKIARRIEDEQLVDKAYRTLKDPTSRKQWLENFALRKGGSSLEGLANIEIRFSSSGGHTDYRFNIVENPVRVPFAISQDLQVNSIPEYVIRAWEDEEILEDTIDTRTLERWLRYSAGETDIANRIQYAIWEPRPVSFRTIGYSILDLLQSRYPIPILPKSSPRSLEYLQSYRNPKWTVAPGVLSFGLIPAKVVIQTVIIKHWKKHPGEIKVTCNIPELSLNLSKLNHLGAYSQFDVTVDGSRIERGKWLRGEITITSEHFGSYHLKVIGARYLMTGNDALRAQVSSEAGDAWLAIGDYENAAEMFRIANRSDDAKKAEYQDIKDCFNRHEWERVISKTREYHQRYGREKQTIIWRVEALRMIGASYYQLGEYALGNAHSNKNQYDYELFLRRRKKALPYLAAIAYETSRLPDEKLPDDCWTVNPESQIILPATPCIDEWVDTADTFNLEWTHAEGVSNRSKYAGDMPINLKDRGVVWRSSNAAIKSPIIAHKGVLVARAKDTSSIVGISAASGKVMWRFTEGMNGGIALAEPVAGTPQTDDPDKEIPSVFVTDSTGRLHRLNIKTGKPIWSTDPVPHARDLNIVLSDNALYLATGRQILIFDALTGNKISQSQEMTMLGAGMNPMNMMVSNGRCMFQINEAMGVKGDGLLGGVAKLAGVNLESPAIVQLDSKTGKIHKTKIPSEFGNHAILPAPPFAWAAQDNLIFMASTISYHLSYKNQENKTISHQWSKRFLSAYDATEGKFLFGDEQLISGTAYSSWPRNSNFRHTSTSANAITVAPVDFEGTSGTMLSVAPYERGITEEYGKFGFIIAAAFGNVVFYWMLTDGIKFIGTRKIDGQVQSILFSAANDIVISNKTVSTSVAGFTNTPESTTYYISQEVGNISGNPALFGDVMYVVTSSGEVVAIAR